MGSESAHLNNVYFDCSVYQPEFQVWWEAGASTFHDFFRDYILPSVTGLVNIFNNEFL